MTIIPWIEDSLATELPWLSVAQMVEVDRAMVDDFQILLLQMMELAGRHLASLARARFLADAGPDASVVILAGPGGNGGGALACARRLAGWGTAVSVVTSATDEDFTPVPLHQLRTLRRLNVSICETGDELPAQPALIIDGLIGYSLRGAPRGRAAELIHWANQATASVLSLDVPSGLDPSSGEPFDPAIRATATLTLALPKLGLRAAGAAAHVGELYLGDIGVPRQLYRRSPLDLRVPDIFAGGDLVRLPTTQRSLSTAG
ncbi:MAG: NAD(P)H-hydrate epimerase [Gemmatimonadaceae bacterium]